MATATRVEMHPFTSEGAVERDPTDEQFKTDQVLESTPDADMTIPDGGLRAWTVIAGVRLLSLILFPTVHRLNSTTSRSVFPLLHSGTLCPGGEVL